MGRCGARDSIIEIQKRAMGRFRDIKTLQKFAADHFITAKPSNSIAPPLWPSGVNLQPERPRLLALLVRSS